MKRKLTLILCGILFFATVFTMPAFATQKVTLPDHSMALYLPDDFTLITTNTVEQHEETLQAFGSTVTQTQIKMQEQNYLVLGISRTMNCTLYLSATTDSVSQTICDLITYPQKETAKALLLGKQLPKNATVQELEQRGALFYRVDFGVEETIGRIAYFTVINGTCYTLGLVDNAGTLNENMNNCIDTAFHTWEYTIAAETAKIQAFKDRVTTIFYWACLPVALLLCALIIRFLVKDFRKKEENRKRIENIPKKPRR